MTGWLEPKIRNARDFVFGPLVEAINHVGASAVSHIKAVALVRLAKAHKRTIFFVGNGASAAIASHMAADFLKAGGMRAQCFSDPALATCVANDLGYVRVFAHPLSVHGNKNDVLVAISSSGKSANIIAAVDVAIEIGMRVITLSGMDVENPLRKRGDINFYVPSGRYGVVEVTHHAILHAILDEVVES